MSNIKEYTYIKDTICWLSNICVLKIVVPLMIKQKLNINKAPITSEYRYEHNTPTGYGITLMRDIRPSLSIEFLTDKEKGDNAVFIYPENIINILSSLEKVRTWKSDGDKDTPGTYAMIRNKLQVVSMKQVECSLSHSNKSIRFISSIIDYGDYQDLGVNMLVADRMTTITYGKVDELIYLFSHLDIYTYASSMINYLATPYINQQQIINSNSNSHLDNEKPKYKGSSFFDRK